MPNIKNFSRRKFIAAMSASSFAMSIASAIPAFGNTKTARNTSESSNPDIVDTNINLFEWPFRRMKYGETKSLVTKLRRHRITQAWACSFDALFSKSINEVNARLAEECRINGEGVLIPFGTVNISWPDWEEDLRRCHEVYRMPGIRLYPTYQCFDFLHIDFPRLVNLATERGLIIQIVGDMEDSRVHHPIVLTRDVKFDPLVDIMRKNPHAKIELLNWNKRVSRELQKKFVLETKVMFDIAYIESVGAVGKLINGNTWHGQETSVPVERILFGSHAPLLPVESSIIKLFESLLTLEEMQAIMGLNAHHFIKNV